MKKYLWLFFIVATSSLHAWLQPEAGKYALQAEVLWLNAALDDTYYVMRGDPFVGIDGERTHVGFDFHPAYRLQGAYTFCNNINDFRLQGTYYSHTVSDSADASLVTPISILLPTQLPPAEAAINSGQAFFAEATNHVRYYSIDGLFGHMVYSDCLLDLSLQGGFHYLHLNVTEKYDYESSGSFNIVRYHNNMWGIGPEMGLDVRYLPSICTSSCLRGLSFVGNVKGGLLVVKNRAGVSANNNIVDSPFLIYDFQSEANWRLAPVLEVTLGLNYVKQFSCCAFSLELGYELLTYEKALNKIRITNYQDGGFNAASGASFDEYGNFGLHGPYLALGLTY